MFRHIVDTVCINCLFLLSIILLHDIWFVTPDPVLLLFQSPFLLTDLPRTAHKNVSSSLVRDMYFCYSDYY